MELGEFRCGCVNMSKVAGRRSDDLTQRSGMDGREDCCGLGGNVADGQGRKQRDCKPDGRLTALSTGGFRAHRISKYQNWAILGAVSLNFMQVSSSFQMEEGLAPSWKPDLCQGSNAREGCERELEVTRHGRLSGSWSVLSTQSLVSEGAGSSCLCVSRRS